MPAGEGLGDGTGGSGVGVGVGAPPTQPQAMNRTAPTIEAWIVQRRQGTPSKATSTRGSGAAWTTARHPRTVSTMRDQERSASRLIVRPPYGLGSSGRNVLLRI